MRKSILWVSGLLFFAVFSKATPAGEVAIYTGNVNWIDKASADAQAEICVSALTTAGITNQWFSNPTDASALATWVQGHTGNGDLDVLILYGYCPGSIYPVANGQPDGSIAEAFIESTDGDAILNHADWIFYVSSTNNGTAALQYMTDIPGISMSGIDTAVTVTPLGATIAPSLDITMTDRAFRPTDLAGDWYVEASLAQNTAGTLADPMIVRDGNRGRLIIAYQTQNEPANPKGAVAAEIITYLMEKETSQLALVGPATTVEGTPVRYKVQLQDDLGLPTSAGAVTVSLATSSVTGAFDTARKGGFDGTVTSVTIPAGMVTATFYYKDATIGMSTLTASAPGLAAATLEVNVMDEIASDPGEVAIYTGAVNWTDPVTANAQAKICGDRLDVMGITHTLFDDAAMDAELADWVSSRTNNGELDVVILFGYFPSSLYPVANGQPDGSIAEQFIESNDGDAFINHADYMFYFSSTNNGSAGLQNMMDIPGMSMWDPFFMSVTPDGREIAPSLAEYQSQANNGLYFATSRPLFVDLLAGDWFVEVALAENSSGMRSEPIVVRDGNRGRLIPVFQVANRNDPKGAVASEIIAWLHGINLGDPVKLGILGRPLVAVSETLTLTVQAQSFLGSPAPGAARTVSLQSTSGTGRFDTSFNGSFTSAVGSVTIPAGEASATFYYKDSTAGTPTLTASTAGLTSGTTQASVVGRTFAPPGQVAIYTTSVNPDWVTKATADAQAAICEGRLESAGIPTEIFESFDDMNALVDWMDTSRSDGFLDVLVLFGVLPDELYPVGNAQTNFSTAERFIESADGNAIINLGDWMFYCDYDAAGTRSVNGAAGLQNMMDIPGVTMAGFDNTLMTVTDEGRAIAPSLNDFLTDRPLHLDTLAGDWVVEAVLAQNADGTLAEPVIVRDGTKGRLIPVFQTILQADPKGAVTAEIISWLMQKELLPTELGLSGSSAVVQGRVLEFTVTLEDAAGITYPAQSAVGVTLTKDSATGAFDTAKDGAFNGSVTAVTIPAGEKSATFFYKDTAVKLVTLSANAAGLLGATLQVNVLEDVAVTQGEVAIYTGNVNWIDKAIADTQAGICEAALNAAGITNTWFSSDADVDALATWMTAHTNNGALDVLVLYGYFPGSIYPVGNAQPNDSIAEAFIESTDGDAIMNHADWMFYVSSTNNGTAGLQNMMDLPGVTMAGYDNTPMTVTSEGSQIAPSLTDFVTDRPLHLDTLGGNWWVEATLAQGANKTLAEPVIVRDGNLGRLIPVYQTNATADPISNDDPKGAVAAEIIAWLMEGTSGGIPENCTNGSDDDGDGDIDCADSDCASLPACQGIKFYRADPNNDGACNITDGIYILNYLFLGGPKPTCQESADPNNDGLVNITDGIYVLNYLFLGGPSPLPPGPPGKGTPCGADTDAPGSAKDLGCAQYTKCP